MRLIDADELYEDLANNEDGCGDGEQIYDDGRSQGRYEAFSKAIEIVKGGGVDE